MNRMIRLLVVCAVLGAAVPALAAGLMKPKDSNLPDLEIRQHSVDVVINNGFAITEVDQIFFNPHDRDLDAMYTFPLPKDASLSELSLWIDSQEVVGEVVEKERGREIARREKDAGRESALAEKREYYSFDVFVSPVRAGAETRVRLVYLQPIEIDSGIGRYVYPLDEGEIDTEVQSFWTRQELVHGSFEFECTIRSSYPLDDVRTTTDGRAVIAQNDPTSWTVWIQRHEGTGSLDEDIVVYYRLAENLPARVDLLPYRDGEGDGTFMLVVTPGADLEETTGGVDWSIALDVSGSMAGKIVAAGDAVARALDHLRAEDRFRVFTFANGARPLFNGWQPANEAAIGRAQDKLRNLQSEGGTNLFAGFEASLKGLDTDRPSAVIVVSDGGANVGPTEHADFLKLMQKQDVRVFTFVMGQGANRPLLGRLAEESGGFSLDISNRDDLYGRILQAKAKLGREALHGVRLELDGASEMAPHRLPSAYHGQQIVAFGKYRKPGPATLKLHARISGQEQTWKTTIDLPKHDTTYPELERLWAFATTRDLQRRIDDGEDRSELEQAIVDLAVEHSIVTDYTSMIVVRDEVFDELGIDRRNKKRVENERAQRAVRMRKEPPNTRVDQSQPMFGNRPSGGLGGGAVGPGFVGLLAGLYGWRLISRRRGRKDEAQ
jgi:Ca-activated chloride channel family protein